LVHADNIEGYAEHAHIRCLPQFPITPLNWTDADKVEVRFDTHGVMRGLVLGSCPAVVLTQLVGWVHILRHLLRIKNSPTVSLKDHILRDKAIQIMLLPIIYSVVAYKNVIGARRASWRIVSSVKDKEETKNNDKHISKIVEYRKKIEAELAEICNDVIAILQSDLIPKAESSESKVFYYKMVGDYHRYLAEFSQEKARADAADAALEGYKNASSIAESDCSPTNPIRLGLALNFSVFHYEVMNSPEKACSLAKSAFDDAIAELDTLSEDSYKDSTLIMQLLRDNLTLWTSDMEDKGGDKEQ